MPSRPRRRRSRAGSRWRNLQIFLSSRRGRVRAGEHALRDRPLSAEGRPALRVAGVPPSSSETLERKSSALRGTDASPARRPYEASRLGACSKHRSSKDGRNGSTTRRCPAPSSTTASLRRKTTQAVQEHLRRAPGPGTRAGPGPPSTRRVRNPAHPSTKGTRGPATRTARRAPRT